MAILYNKISSTPIPNQNAALTYNFNKVILSGLDTSPQRYINIDLSFPGYSAFINSVTNSASNSQLLKTLKTISSSNNITYYDAFINATKQYKINYIHVGISPIDLKQIYSWCVMLDLTTTTSESLIVIIPINYLSLSTVSDSVLIQNEKPDFSKLVYNCNYSTNNAIDINTFMLPNTYHTIYDQATASKNRVIIFNKSISTYFYDVINSSKITLNPLYINNIFLSSSVYIATLATLATIPSTQIYVCSKLPIRTNDILQNDIYIDCYKVGESDKVVGGITNPSSVSKNRKGNSEVQLALFSIIIAFVLMYGVFKLYQLSNSESTKAPFGFKFGPKPAITE